MKQKRRFALKPLKKKERAPKKYAVCDIESTKWIGFLCIGYYNGETFKYFRKLKTFIEFLPTKESRTIFAHFGGIFDYLFLFEEFLKLGFKIFDMIPRGSGVLCFKVEIEKEIFIFRDSSALFPYALERLTKSFDVDHKKKSIDFDNLTEVTDELVEYLEYDCKGLYESLEKFWAWEFIKYAGPAYTEASQALKVFRTFLKEPIPSLTRKQDAFIRSGFCGGRTEIFKPLFESKTKVLRLFDVNSLYPFCMLSDMPGMCLGETEEYNKKFMGFYFCKVRAPKMHIPFLGIKIKGKYIFPQGEFEGVYTSLEIEYARSLGYKIKTENGILFKNGGPIFKEYIETFHRIKNQSKKDTVDYEVAKKLMNTLFGRFGIRTDRETIEFDTGQSGVTVHKEFEVNGKLYRLVKKPKELETFTQVGVADWVTSIGKIHMHKLYMQAPNEIYYTDTDSMYTTHNFKEGFELGDLTKEPLCGKYHDHETECFEIRCIEGSNKWNEEGACFLLPKTYKAGRKVVMKGFDKKKIQHFTVEDFKLALSGDQKHMKIIMPPRFQKLKSAIRSGLGLVSMSKVHDKPQCEEVHEHIKECFYGRRKIKKRYDKRELYTEHGVLNTRPWVLKGPNDGINGERTNRV